MDIKDFRRNMDKIGDDGLWDLLNNVFIYGRNNIYYFNEIIERIDIEDYMDKKEG